MLLNSNSAGLEMRIDCLLLERVADSSLEFAFAPEDLHTRENLLRS